MMNLPKFRPTTIAGGGMFALTLIVLGMIACKPELTKDDLFKSLSQAIVVQGLIGLCVASYFTRRSADSSKQEPDE
ncbi:hypothetical protein F1640_18315 [Novosphingobium sp. NBM11]|uniref:hypothetical protein n=1 Tax=Novosphingobium sp. NBM11 TaxID=2596914 RepID=UPI0018921E7C|nr:hypothetical protein [Novosphingobium sp. NBM11]MBF5091910.1 hypothetical protein [Novosphingobium sp. NBM11]